MGQPKKTLNLAQPARRARRGSEANFADIIPAERPTTQAPLRVRMTGEGPTGSDLVLEGR